VRGARAAGRGACAGTAPVPLPLAEVDASTVARFSSGFDELDRVLGGGIVPGSVVLVGGEPGIGKSTLLLQVLDAVSAARPVLLVCGEESPAQVKLRAQRVGTAPGAIRVLAETELGAILAAAEAERPELLVLDSVQTVYSEELSSAPGSVSQVRECAAAFQRYAKTADTAVFLVGHVTKDGAIAGPRVLEHVVDTVLQFEGDRDRFYRVLRAAKNRFGSTNELGMFEMGSSGLTPVSDPSRIFAAGERRGPGSCLLAAVEGTRCFLVEVQALVHPSELAVPRRVTTGFGRDRLAMIIAVLGRHAGTMLSSADIFVNIAGGIRIEEPAADLAVAAAVVSAQRGLPLPLHTAVFGEISLTGEVRASGQPERRFAEAAKAACSSVFLPAADRRGPLAREGAAIGIADVGDLVSRLFGMEQGRGRPGDPVKDKGV
jgi:DNA repair protein RadA/Sms